MISNMQITISREMRAREESEKKSLPPRPADKDETQAGSFLKEFELAKRKVYETTATLAR